MARVFLNCALALVFLLGPSSVAISADVDQGQELYMRYCSSCHGDGGRGDGKVSPYLKIKVPDLTLLEKNHKGIYPLDDVMSAIDGRRSMRGHGESHMPVWGEIFAKELKEKKYTTLTTLLRAKIIAEYVETLQR